MDTNRLHMFKTLVETGNLRKAADLLNISHAGLSKAIRVLEDELGVALTSKDGRNIKITYEGKRIYRELGSFFEAERRLLSLSNQTAKTGTTLKVGTFEVFSTYLAPLLIQNLDSETHFEWRELIPGKIERAILDGQVDIGISYAAVPNSELDHLEVGRIEMGVFALAKSPFLQKPLEELPFVVPIDPVEGSPTKVRGLDGWPDNKLKRHIKFRVDLMESALSFVRSGLAVAYLPKFVVQLHNEIVSADFALKEIKTPISAQQKQKIFLIKRSADEESKMMKKIAAVLRALK